MRDDRGKVESPPTFLFIQLLTKLASLGGALRKYLCGTKARGDREEVGSPPTCLLFQPQGRPMSTAGLGVSVTQKVRGDQKDVVSDIDGRPNVIHDCSGYDQITRMICRTTNCITDDY